MTKYNEDLRTMDDWGSSVHCKNYLNENEWEKEYLQCDKEVCVMMTWKGKDEFKRWNNEKWSNGEIKLLKIPNSIDKYGFTPTATVTSTNAVCYVIVDDMYISWFSTRNVCRVCYATETCTCDIDRVSGENNYGEVNEENVRFYLEDLSPEFFVR